MNYQIQRSSDLILDVRGTYRGGDAFSFLLLSDLHYDHPYCDRKALHKVLDEAIEQDAGILMNGDILCLMQARDDKRSSKSSIREEHQGANYFDLVIKDTAEKFSPYAKNLILMSDGNHETAVVKHKEIDPLDHLAHRLNGDYGANVFRGGYHGFIRFSFEHESGGATKTFLMYHHHGKYGGEVTKGVLGVARHGVIVTQPDCIWTGHTHDAWHVPQAQLMVGRNETYTRLAHHIKTGAWKDEFNRKGGFGVERNYKAVVKAGYWMTFSFRNSEMNVKFTMAQ